MSAKFEKVILVPSGDHSGSSTAASSVGVMTVRPVPSTFTVARRLRPAETWTKASFVPSGDHVGSPSLTSFVTCFMPVPSAFTIMIPPVAPCEFEKAIFVASADHAGSAGETPTVGGRHHDAGTTETENEQPVRARERLPICGHGTRKQAENDCGHADDPWNS